uniref:Protein kinase domain-containing protein n=1 Tax=Rhizophora mucronata TaxID=61149 RepID=A0A2P2PLX4_RHIMU
MGYFSCDAESAISTCDPYNWDRKRRKNRPRTNKAIDEPTKIREFTYSEIVKATNGFSVDSFLGKGSHGTVYKATLDDGKLVAAVKKTTLTHQHRNNCTTYSAPTPADNEIEILSRVRHPQLVNLIGFCVDPKPQDRKLLVVEYLPNGSLYDLLHSITTRPPGWNKRVRFALQVAKGIQALHSSNPPVTHRDIKSSNVLIDENWNARLGDFGLALRGHVEDVRVKCTPPAGTLGYLDPAYLAPGDVSAKSDVFSFGILLLEIISGRNAIDVNYSPPSVVDWAVPLIKRGDFSTIGDRRVGAPADPRVIRNLAILAARCVRSTAEKRPEISEVVEGLECIRKRLNASPMWSQLRRRVKRVEECHSLDAVVDGRQDVVSVGKTIRMGSRRNKKVSTVSSADYGSKPIGWVGDRVIRSRSIGSFGDLKMGTDLRPKQTVKMPSVKKLSKSKSTGRLVHYSNKGFVFEFGEETHSSPKKENDAAIGMPGLLFIGLDDKSEKEMQEKPLVST